VSTEDLRWQALAACRFTDSELFFPVGKEPVDPEAQAACKACPVRAECLAWAYATGDRHAYLGGTTWGDREAVRRNQRRRRQQQEVAA
jgi:WhiB family redox-sensing transcriptional regulator